MKCSAHREPDDALLLPKGKDQFSFPSVGVERALSRTQVRAVGSAHRWPQLVLPQSEPPHINVPCRPPLGHHSKSQTQSPERGQCRPGDGQLSRR
ncbi:hypothetical protein SKAU_G00384220 [Synaphobranchus kaupii]|uniref:Uncharacterized protein n=1 Tax=Synaphobranchus kaupii TaxID=118154 RepID=A0A9Q1IEY7_SYNKA|nr:hypothetical protein SKAU_G00384220 [Synaphobranchus kaupii]